MRHFWYSRLKLRHVSFLALTSALVVAGSTRTTVAQDCDLINGVLVEGCEHTNAGTAVTMPTQPNVELEDVPDLGVDGFEISVDGDPVAQDGTVISSPSAKKKIIAKKRIQDIRLAQNEISVKFDGLDIRPRLNIETVGPKTVYQAGDAVTFENAMNYPAFVTRGEIRIINQARRGGAKTVAVIPMDPNDRISVQVPTGEGLVYVYRVYDDRGRFDETAPAALGAKSRRGAVDGVEEGIDATAIRRIPVYGGSVTVSGRDISRGATVSTLGTQVKPDPQGNFVIQRILPSGDHVVDVDVAGGPSLARDIEIPAHDLFYIGLIDVTLGKRLENDLLDATGEPYDDIVTEGRVAFYLKGKVKGDYLITAAADTGYDDIGDLLKNFDEKNPRSLLDRIDPDEYYPVYGDDSTSEITAPTSGKLFIKVEKDDSHVMWGNFKSEIRGTEYLRNERTLYGAQAVYRSPQQTGNGDARFEAQIYAAQPETLPQRDVFLGTGGSSYFLKFQDITRGSETLLIEIQDPDTGLVIDRQTLVYGVDYDINYVQGLVVLKRPLSANAAGSDLITSNPNGDNKAYLVANYDFTPTASDVDAFSFGGRIQVWANDRLRLGLSAMDEDLGTTEQKAYGVDLLYRVSEQSFAELEFARTDGVGRSEDISLDGGLTLDTSAGASGDGRAVRFKGQADLRDLGANVDGVIGGYFEDRTAGFSTLNYRSTVDEELWGLFAEFEPNSRTKVRLAYDDFQDGAGKVLREGGIAIAWQRNDRVTWDIGAERLDQVTPGNASQTGERTDVALRYSFTPDARRTFYAFGQATVARSGGLEKNNRLGFGGEYQVNDNWRVSGEISDGTTGVGARFLASYDRDANSSAYFGWTLDPDREFGGVDLTGRDKGQFVAGARRKLNNELTVFAENTYDLFGEHKSLTSVYGAEYAVSEYLTLTGGLEFGRVNDAINGTDFDRHAISLGSQYRDEKWSVGARVEYRQDKGVQTGANKDGDTIAGSLTARYKISEEARLLFNAEAIRSTNATASIPNAEYTELTFGYAFRPIDNDRLNVLAKYQYIADMTERVAASPASGANFEVTPRQRAHIFSVDGSYDINNHWTVGAKVGARLSEQDNGAGFVSNDATLGVLNLRYHVVHNWDALLEVRKLKAEDIGSDTGVVAAAYRHVGNNMKIGVGYNFGKFSDDLADVTYNDKGVFLNIVAKF